MNRPKIAHILSDTNIGGAGILLRTLSVSLAGEYDWQVLLPPGARLAPLLAEQGVAVREVPMHPERSFDLSDVRLFYRLFREDPPDIVHTHASLSARVGAARAGVPCLLSTRHCAGRQDEQRGIGGQAKKWFYNRYTTFTVSTAKAATEELIRGGVYQNRIVRIPNGTPPVPPLTRGEKAALREALGLSAGQVVLGCCGRLEEVKGQDVLLRAFALLHRENPRLVLLLVGDGSLRGEYTRLAGTLGIGGAVRFTGYTDRPGAYENLFFLNINASRSTETCCLVTSECMSLGIPTVASSFGGNPEMIEDGTSGLLYPKEDFFALAKAVRSLLCDPLLYARLCRGARRRYEEAYTAEAMAAAYRSLYDTLLAGRRTRAR